MMLLVTTEPALSCGDELAGSKEQRNGGRKAALDGRSQSGVVDQGQRP